MLGMKAEIAELKAALSNCDTDLSHDHNSDRASHSSDLTTCNSDFSGRKHSPTSLIKYPVEDLLAPISSEEVSSHSPSLSLEESEKETIIAALERNPSDKKLAAEELGISLRTLYRKIKELGIDF